MLSSIDAHARRALVRPLLAAAAVLASAPGVRAQDCRPPGAEEHQTMPVCPVAPRVTLSPGTAAVSQPSVTVAITAEDEVIDGDTASFRVLLDNVDVTGTWMTSRVVSGWGTGRVWTTSAAGAVPLSRAVPRRTVEVRLCDATECTVRTAVYTLSLPGVSVTPDGTPTTTPSGATRTRTFAVRNTGTEPATFQLAAECRDGVSGAVLAGCTAPATVTVEAGASASVAVSFPAPAGASFTLSLSATQSGARGVREAGWMQVTVTPAGAAGTARSGPVLRRVDLNSDSEVFRGRCVTAAVGAGAAYECGDLRLAHALPAHRTRGRAWQPVLLYNSQHAQPRTTVYWDVTLPADAPVPASMQAVLYVASTGQVVNRVYAGSEWSPGSTRRIAVDVDASALPTNQQGYYFQVIAIWSDYGQTSSPVASGFMPLVNRGASPFGQGWWLAGLESLQCLGCTGGDLRLVWTGGDGSRRTYHSIGYNVWEAANPAGPPDTLWLAGGVYTRRPRGGGRVEFDASGQHVRTVNRLRQTTTFTWQNGRVTAVHVPGPGGGADPYYTFVYDGSGRLTHVHAVAPGAATRTVTLSHALNDRRVTSIADPDQRAVRFGYANDGLAGMVRSRTDRRNATQEFVYGPSGRLRQARLALAVGDTVVSAFEAVEEKGLAASVPLVGAHTVLNGARTDVDDRTYIWHADGTAPRRIRDALGGETIVGRTDARFPALATEVVAPGGLKSTAVYDARGRVSQSTVVNPLGDGQNVTTTYAYDDRWDAPTLVQAPGSAPVSMSYDTLGNVEWQQVGDASRRTRFRYYTSGPAAGQLRAVQSPVTAGGDSPRDSLVYDAHGNLAMTVSPAGFLALHYRDALGRDTLTVTPIDAATATTEAGLLASGVRQRTVYDGVMDRVRVTEGIGPPRVHSASTDSVFRPAPSPRERLVVTMDYDEEGALSSVVRDAFLEGGAAERFTTQYEYDRAGRKVVERGSQTGEQRFTHDPAGNVVVARTPAGYETRMEYDALGRLTRRVVPERTYGRICGESTIVLGCRPFPRFPNHGDGYRVSEEWSHYRYDAAGNQVLAENADAVVARGYHPNGAVKTDSTWIRPVEGLAYEAYGMRYTYDTAGRVTALEHPRNLTGGTPATDQFFYDPVTGALGTARSRQGWDFTFHHDNAGGLTSIRLPGAIVDSMRYDVEGRLTWRRESGPGAGELHTETMRYDARGKLLMANNGASVFQNWYSGTGNLVGTDWRGLGANVTRISEEFQLDPLGNVLLRRTSDGADIGGELPRFENFHIPGTGRLLRSRKLPPSVPSSTWTPDETTRQYDASGNVSRGFQQVGGIGTSGDAVVAREVESRSFYGADDRLRMLQTYDVRRKEWSNYESAGVWEEYRYDALGRRVMVRTRTDGGLCDADAWTCTGSVTRFVWAGDNLLWELKQADGSMAGQAGGNVSYFHAGGIDRPLVITKDGQSIIPHQNWRGQFARGTYPNGTRSDCTSYPAIGCTPIQWPGERTTARHELEPDGRIQNWYGGLVDGMRDASGQMYKRNRYYDPATGQFTQPDPIGLAGGLNAYGFAEGDAVSYSDPYGLCPPKNANLLDCPGIRQAVEATTRLGEQATASWADQAVNGSTPASRAVGTGMGLLAALWTPETYRSTVDALVIARRANVAIQGVYEFIGRDGNLYVGQSGDIGRRMQDHVESGKLSPDAEVNVTEVSGGKINREVVEQRRIDQQGGIESGNLSNQRNPVGPRRQHLMRDQ